VEVQLVVLLQSSSVLSSLLSQCLLKNRLYQHSDNSEDNTDED